MVAKIGRNDKCPCGSGKKYKHCCLKEDINFSKTSNAAVSKKGFSFRELFNKYYTIDLVATLAALSIHPQNHGKNLRLEYLIVEALKSNDNDNKEAITIQNLNNLLSQYLPTHYLEDPPGNLFTENIVSTMGNNIVYGGNFEQGAFTLNTLISAINFNIEVFPKPFYDKTNSAFLLLLTLSDIIAKSIGHSRNMLGEYENSKDEIEFPSNIEDYKDAILFPNAWLDDYCQRFRIDISVLSNFLLEFDHVDNYHNEVGDSSNPLITKPILKLKSSYMVVSPCSIVSALIHYTWVQSEVHQCKKILIEKFHKLVFNELALYINKVNFDIIDFQFETDKTLPLKNLLLQIDVDKLVYLSFFYDEGEEYNFNTPCHSDPMNNFRNTEILKEKNLNSITKTFPEAMILDLNLYSTIGREYMMAVQENNATYTIVTSAFHFLCWLKSDSHDQMELWYYLESLDRFQASVKYMFPDFLNSYSFFEKNKSFYLNDEEKPTHFTLLPGGKLKIIKKAIDKEDRIIVHHIVDGITHPVLIPVIKFGDYIPMYINTDNIGRQLEYFIPNYKIDIWIRARNNASEIPKTDFNFFRQLLECYAFWLWQVSDILDEHLKPLNLITLLIKFDINEIRKLEEPEYFGNKIKEIEDEFNLVIKDGSISIIIPWQIGGYFSSQDNEGERILLKKLIESFGVFLQLKQLPNTLTPQVIDDIVNTKAPLGLKKMILFAHSGNSFALDSRNLTKHRYIQESRRQWVMDITVPLLGGLYPPIGEINKIDDKRKLTRSIVVVLLGKLRDILKNYNSKDLLLRVMSIHESILHENALSRLRTPTRLACFSEQEDTVTEILKKTHLVDETTLACRCLIEHLSIEPTYGNQVISTQTIDDIIAIMSLIIWWGGMGDKIEFDLVEVQLAVLPNGRIGTNSREISESFFEKFSESRTREFIDDSLEDFPSMFFPTDESKIPIPVGFENAFTKEVGISFSKLGGIVHLLSQIGLEQQDSVSNLTVVDLYSKIRDSFEEEFSDIEIDAAINFLKMWAWGDVMKPPLGFQRIDISPWRYNRRLSYLQRPLIYVDYGTDEQNPKIYWTPRHLDHSWKYLNHLIMSARYRAKEKSELEKQISKISKNRGKVLQQEVINWLSGNKIPDSFEEIEISQNSILNSPTNLGDIDILAFDMKNKIILSIECKRTEQARNSKEMIEQVEQYFGNKSEKGYFKKHLSRHKWLCENIDKVESKFNIELEQFKVCSIFVTYEILAIQFMQDKPLPIPVYSLFELKKTTYESFIKNIVDFYGTHEQRRNRKLQAMLSECSTEEDVSFLRSVQNETFNGNSGFLRINLLWKSTDDLDLCVETPLGEVSYINREITKGNLIIELDTDANAEEPFISNPQENICLSNSFPGTYKVKVNYYAKRERLEVPFVLSIIPVFGEGVVLYDKVNFDSRKSVDVIQFIIEQSGNLRIKL